MIIQKLSNLAPLLALTLFLTSCATDKSHSPDSTIRIPSELAPMPNAVTSFGAVAHDGSLYVFGGHKGERHEYSAEEVSGAFHRLNLKNEGVWETLPSAAPAQGVALAAHDRWIYRIGGMAAQNHKGEKPNLLSQAVVSRFDLKQRQWQPIAPLPQARSSHDAAVIGNKLYVGGGWQMIGGTNKAVWHDTLLVLDLSDSRSHWKPIAQPFKRRALAIAALGSKLYFLGGMDSDNKTSLAVDIYDTRSNEWSKGPELTAGPMKGFGCSATAQNGRLYYSGMKGEIYALSATGQSWDLAGKLQHPRFFHRLAPLGAAQLLAAGGEDSEGKRRDIELITPSLNVTTAQNQTTTQNIQ